MGSTINPRESNLLLYKVLHVAGPISCNYKHLGLLDPPGH